MSLAEFLRLSLVDGTPRVQEFHERAASRAFQYGEQRRGIPTVALAFEANSRCNDVIHAREDPSSNPGAARIREETLEQIVCLVQGVGGLLLPS